MDRRKTLRLAILSFVTALASGCKTRVKPFDSQPKRSFLEDRWPGHYFDTVTARYTLRLQNPAPSLSRASKLTIPIFTSDGREIGAPIGLPTLRPIRALVSIRYDAKSTADCEIVVTVYWPVGEPTPIDGRRETDETKTAFVGFEDIRRFIDGTGRFRCDDDHHFYGPLSEAPRLHTNEFDVTVHCQISGESPGSHFSGDIRYRDGRVLYRLAELAVPGIG